MGSLPPKVPRDKGGVEAVETFVGSHIQFKQKL